MTLQSDTSHMDVISLPSRLHSLTFNTSTNMPNIQIFQRRINLSSRNKMIELVHRSYQFKVIENEDGSLSF